MCDHNSQVLVEDVFQGDLEVGRSTEGKLPCRGGGGRRKKSKQAKTVDFFPVVFFSLDLEPRGRSLTFVGLRPRFPPGSREVALV